jgi:ribokinase
MTKPVMVSIGKMGQDVFLQGDVFKPLKEKGVFYERIKLGEKFYVDDAAYSLGGNAAHAAITFARQGFESKFITVLGDDPAGHALLKTLDGEHIDTTLIKLEPNLKTSFSTILLAPTGERTILDYPGTATLTEDDLQLDELSCDWLYISSVGSMPLLKKIMKTAHQKEIKVAFNPSSFELKHAQECADLLSYVTLFAVNKEEAEQFVDGANIKDLAKKLSESVQYVLVSDGAKGSVATDGIELVTAGMYEDVPVVDRTGAGDAFTSGFVSQIALGQPIEQAVTFASANSTSVVAKIGASEGILRAPPKLHAMDLKLSRL